MRQQPTRHSRRQNQDLSNNKLYVNNILVVNFVSYILKTRQRITTIVTSKLDNNRVSESVVDNSNVLQCTYFCTNVNNPASLNACLSVQIQSVFGQDGGMHNTGGGSNNNDITKFYLSNIYTKRTNRNSYGIL